MAESTIVGLTMTEYMEYIQLIELNLFYSDIVSHEADDIVNFDKAINDTIRRWEFITGWVERQHNKNSTVMKSRIESPRITEIMMLDEPLCFEDMVCEKKDDRCTCCPLWHITGHPCEHALGLKYKVTYAWIKGSGFFYPKPFVAVLKKIKAGKPIKNIDLNIFTGVW